MGIFASLKNLIPNQAPQQMELNLDGDVGNTLGGKVGRSATALKDKLGDIAGSAQTQWGNMGPKGKIAAVTLAAAGTVIGGKMLANAQENKWQNRIEQQQAARMQYAGQGM